MGISFTHLRPKDYFRSQWKNGLGFTDQIAIHPPGTDLRRGDYLWRVSTAKVAQSAPFSIFPDHDRVLVILEGPGVRLSHVYETGDAPEVVSLSPLEPYEFPGDIQTHCELQGGAIQDFSVFFRRGVISAEAEIMEAISPGPREWIPDARTCVFFVADGAVEIQGTRIEKGESLRIDVVEDTISSPVQAKSLRIEAVSDSTRLILVRLNQ